MAGFYYCPKMSISDLFVPAFMQDYMRKGERRLVLDNTIRTALTVVILSFLGSLMAISLGDGSPEGEMVAIDGRGRYS